MSNSTVADGSAYVPPYLCIVGPTGSGKSSLGMQLAEAIGGEIVNADSVQFYRGFSIGAAKPSSEDQARIPHHLLDIVDAEEDFTAADFAAQARIIIADIARRGRMPIVIGGSGLYLRCLWGERFHTLPHNAAIKDALRQQSSEELYAELCRRDPQRASELHANDRVRVIRSLEVCLLSGQAYSSLVAEQGRPDFLPRLRIFLNPPKAQLDAALRARVEEMIRLGLVDEVRALLAQGCSPTAKPMQSIGYKQVIDYLAGTISGEEELKELIYTATRQYAKRQMTWFRKTSAELELAAGGTEAVAAILNYLASPPSHSAQ